MRSKMKQVPVVLAALALMVFIASSDLFAQGRGKGRGNDDRGGRQNVERPGRGWDQQRSDKESRRQQAESDRRSRMQQQRSDWESRRQQAESDRRSRMQQQRSDWESRRQQAESDRRSRNVDLWQGFPQSPNRGDNRYRNENPRARWNRPANGTPPWANRNYERPAQNRIRQEIKRQYKEDRKYERNVRKNGKWPIAALPYRDFLSYYDYDPKYKRRAHRDRRDELAERRREYYRYPAPIVYYTPQVENWFPLAAYREPNYYGQSSYGDIGRDRSYYSALYYADRYYGYDNDDYYGVEDDYYGREDWRSSLLRMILGAVFGRSGVGYFARPAYAGSYDQYYPPPVYYYAEPIGSYDPFYMNAYSDPFAKDTLERVAATGYCRGYMDALNARRFGINDYNDPYAYNGGWFDNYSVSFTERQRLLSQGYELGYRDAMANRDHYGIAEGGGTLDLVSVLLENVLLSGAI